MDPISASHLGDVLDAMAHERSRLIELLTGLEPTDWDRPTECPAWSVTGIAAHILGDDLSLLSRQRDNAPPGLLLMAETMPGSDFRQLLDGFNDQWVHAVRFFSPALLIELLRFSGEETDRHHRQIDPETPGEPVPIFNPTFDGPSPFWQAVAREYLERWTHHSQILRALDRPTLGDEPFLEVGVRIVASASGVEPLPPRHDGGDRDAGTSAAWSLGSLELGRRDQAADILTLRHTASEVATLIAGPDDLVADFAAVVGRRMDSPGLTED